MTDRRRKFSIFISSTYEDLVEERQALLGVALENNFIPVGMEQFHAAPADQWDVIMKMIDECDFYLLMVGGRYGSIDESVDKSYTEKEYDYARSKNLPILVLIKRPETITEDKKDKGYAGHDKYELMRRLDAFREKVKGDHNTVDFFGTVDELKYVASPTLRNAIEYADTDAGWVRYSDIVSLINEEANIRNKANAELSDHQQELLEGMKKMLSEFGEKLNNIENKQITWEEMPVATKADIDRLFVDGETLVIDGGGPDDHPSQPVVGKDNVGNIPTDSAFLLVYAASDNGQIMKIQTLGSPVQITAAGKQFQADNSQRESAKWQEALDRLISWGWVKPVGYKGEIFELTGTGYDKADWLKEGMGINTDNEPLDELKEFE